MSSKKKISIALVGAGRMGEKWAEAIYRHPETELGAVIDIDYKKALLLASKYRRTPAYQLQGDIIDGVKINTDAACIVVPSSVIAGISKAFLACGKHVLVEKPVARTPEELAGVLDLTKSRNLKFMAGYNYRYHTHIKKAMEIYRSGAIGKIMFIRGVHAASGRVGYEKEWRHQKEAGGGVLLDQAVHMIDLSRWFLGDFTKINGTLKNFFWGSEVEDNAFLHLETPSGQIVSLHASWTSWKPQFTFEVFGTEGYIIAEGLKRYTDYEKVTLAKRKEDFSSSLNAEDIKIYTSSSYGDYTLLEELDEFVAALHENRDPQPSIEDALEVLKVVSKIYSQAT